MTLILSQSDNLQIITNAIKSDRPDERIRVQLQVHQQTIGYAIEVTRKIFDEEYVYIGFVSLATVNKGGRRWVAQQKQFIEDAFKNTAKSIGN